MSLRATRATASRVLGQLRRDPRTIALLLVVPCVLQVLVDQILARPAADVPAASAFRCSASSRSSRMFLVTSITMLRERTSGTLERLLTLPIAKLDLLVGYGARVRGGRGRAGDLVSVVGFGLLGLESGHAKLLVVGLAIANADSRHGAGAASRARSRAPSSRRCSSCPRSSSRRSCSAGCSSRATTMADWLQWLSALHAVHVRVRRARSRSVDRTARRVVLARRRPSSSGSTVLALVLGAGTLRRRTP